MRTPEQVTWDFVSQWLEKARNDLKAAEVLFQSGMEAFEVIGFHAQQAAEKFIKSALVRYQIEFPKMHDIGRLRRLLAQSDLELAERLALADTLSPYAVELRYPGDLVGPVSREQAEEALRLAEQTQDEVLKSLRPYLDAGRPPNKPEEPS